MCACHVVTPLGLNSGAHVPGLSTEMAIHMPDQAVDLYRQIPRPLGSKLSGRIGPNMPGSPTAQTPTRLYGQIPARTPARLYGQMAGHLGAKPPGWIGPDMPGSLARVVVGRVKGLRAVGLVGAATRRIVADVRQHEGELGAARSRSGADAGAGEQ